MRCDRAFLCSSLFLIEDEQNRQILILVSLSHKKQHEYIYSQLSDPSGCGRCHF